MQKLCGAVKDVRKFPFTNARQLENWQEKARKQLNRLLNVVRDKRLSPPVFNGREIFKEHIREHWSIETEHGICMPFYLLIPQGKGPFPPALGTHGGAVLHLRIGLQKLGQVNGKICRITSKRTSKAVGIREIQNSPLA